MVCTCETRLQKYFTIFNYANRTNCYAKKTNNGFGLLTRYNAARRLIINTCLVIVLPQLAM